MAAKRPVEERRLVDDVRAGGHRLDRCLGSRAQLLATIRDRAVELDCHWLSALSTQVSEKTALVLEPALPDDVQLRIVPDGSFDQDGHRRPLELRQMFTGQECN